MRTLFFFLLAAPVAALAAAEGPDQASFSEAVSATLSNCVVCHNAQMASGGLNVKGYDDVASVKTEREHWEIMLQKIESGEMPPSGFPAIEEDAKAKLVSTVRAEMDRLDSLAPPDPGRVTARRLNRNEYAYTIRDLLGVGFNAQDEFPTDDSGYGFDNIGDVLTISPILMEEYMAAAETISRRAIGADPLPEKPVEATYDYRGAGNMGKFEQLGPGRVRIRHRLDWDGEYRVRFGLQGERPKGSAPVRLAIWRDGEKLNEIMASTEPSGLVFFDPFSSEEMTLYLSAGDSTFEVGFIDDNFTEGMSKEDIYDREKNKFIGDVTFTGPFPSDVEPPSRKKILTCDPNSGDACIERIISQLARKAYRRPVTEKEVADLTRFVALGKKEGLSTEQGVQLAIQAMLVSPHFLFRVESDPNPTDPTAIHKVSDIELASRLSYFLWCSMPDEELLSLAESGKLADPATLDQQIERMLADPKSERMAENFSGQWLETRNLDTVNPDPDLFPEWGTDLREAMKAETSLFFDAILRENRPMTEFLDADFTFLNDRLAKHYGIEGVSGPEFRRVQLATAQRGGILSHAGVLTVTSYPTRTSPVIRGKYVLENILGAPPPAPPPNVPTLEESGGAENLSVRQQLEAHRANPACATCHKRMDALGFGLENYDAIGQWRSEENDNPIDSTGVLPNGESFASPAELRKILTADKEAFAHTMAEKMMIYALGRGLEPYDRRTLKQITKGVAEDDYRFQTLIREVVHSMPFQMRRGEAVESASARN